MNYYLLQDDVRVFWETESILRIRKGIWNYSEATLNFQFESDDVRKIYKKCAEEFITKRECRLDAILETVHLKTEDKNTILLNFQTLANQSYLVKSDQKFITRSLINLLSLNYPGIEDVQYTQPAFFIGDNACSNNVASFISKEMGYPMDMADAAFTHDLCQVDLTTKSEAIEHLKHMEKYEHILQPYSVVLGCFIRPNIQFLRNLNRVMVKMKKPFILGFVDGPFLSLLATASPETGCFECFEHRVLARLEDTHAYNLFVKATVEQNPCTHQDGEGKSHTPLISLLISALLSEGFLASSIRINKLTGRIFNVYLPTLEIQVQDLLRVPYCPACGHIAAGQMDELYISSRTIIDRMLEKIEVVNV